MPNLTSPGKLYLELKSRDEIANLTAGEIVFPFSRRSIKSEFCTDIFVEVKHVLSTQDLMVWEN